MAGHRVLIAEETAIHNPKAHFLGADERVGHTLVLGTSTTHKPALLWNMMVQDIAAGAGVAVIDVAGRYSRPLLDAIPNRRAHATLFFDPADLEFAVGFNPFRGVPEHTRPRVAQEIMELFKAIWNLDYDRTPLLLDLLRSSARTLLDWPESSFLSFYPLLTDVAFRQRVVRHCRDPLTRRFWTEFDSWPARDQRDKPQPVLTRLRAFLSDPQLRNVLGQIKGKLDIDRVVSNNQIFLAELSTQGLGAETSRLFGCLLATRIRSALAQRQNRVPFYVYIPDAETMHALVSAQLLSEPTAPGGMVVSVDQIGGYQPETRAAFLSAETLVAFRLASDDVRHVQPRFPVAQVEETLPSMQPDRLALSDHRYELAALHALEVHHRNADAIIKRSRNALGIPRQEIEAKIERFFSGL